MIENASVIAPGNWGRIVALTPAHPYSLLEEIYERIRATTYPELPSRKKSLFLFANNEDAKKLQAQRPFDILYQVEIVDINCKTSTLDMSVVNPISLDGQMLLPARDLAIQAKTYWDTAGTNNNDIPEILVEGCIKIINRLD
jgi:hypothetical protein